MESFAAHLHDVRRGARLTQQQLADCLGVDRSVYAMYETGKLDPPPRFMETICDQCGVPSDERRALLSEIEA